MKSILHIASGFRVPQNGYWDVQGDLSDKPRLFWYGKGRFSYKLTGKPEVIWRQEEIPDPPEQPDPRPYLEKMPQEPWRTEWYAYVKEWGIGCAAQGLHTCDYMRVQAALAAFGSSIYPPVELQARFLDTFSIPLLDFGCGLSQMVAGCWTFDLLRFGSVIMDRNGDNFEAFQRREQSMEGWMGDKFGAAGAALCQEAIGWITPDEVLIANTQARQVYYDQRAIAMATTKKLK